MSSIASSKSPILEDEALPPEGSSQSVQREEWNLGWWDIVPTLTPVEHRSGPSQAQVTTLVADARTQSNCVDIQWNFHRSPSPSPSHLPHVSLVHRVDFIANPSRP